MTFNHFTNVQAIPSALGKHLQATCLKRHRAVARCQRIAGKSDDEIRALEHEAVLVSLENLMTFPFVAKAVKDGELSLHGLWTDIGEGTLLEYDPEKGAYAPI